MKTVTRETKPQHPQDDPDHMLLLWSGTTCTFIVQPTQWFDEKNDG